MTTGLDELDARGLLDATTDVVRRPRLPAYARRVAKLSRHLSSTAVAHVDAQVAGVLVSESAGRVLHVAEGAVVGADPWLHQ